MTVRLSVSAPDDPSAAVTEAGRRMLPEARRVRQRAAALANAKHLRLRSADQAEADAALIESSNDIALHNAQW